MNPGASTTTEAQVSQSGTEESVVMKQTFSFFTVAIRKWWLFLLAAAIAGAVGFYYAGTIKPVYESRLSFALDNGSNGGGLAGALNLASQFGFLQDDSRSIFEGDNIIEIIKSRRIVERVLLSVDTFENKPYTFIEYYLEKANARTTLTKDVHFLPGQPKTTFSYLQDSLLFNIYSRFITKLIIAHRPDKKLMLYELKVTTPDEVLTKKLTDRLIDETSSFYVEISSQKAKQVLDVLEERVASMKGNLNNSISSKASTQDANLNPAFAASQVPILKQQVNMQVYSGAYSEMFKNLEMARFQYLKQIPLMQIIDYADYPMKKIKSGRLITAVKFAIVGALSLVILLWIYFTITTNFRVSRENSAVNNKAE